MIPEMALLSGLGHCHVPGLHSYVIRERISNAHGMLRIFHNTGDSLVSLVGPNGEFRLAPHNHRQDIRLFRIFGSAVNIDFSIDRLIHGKQQREWAFGSALLEGEVALSWLNTVDLRVSNATLIPDDGLLLTCDQVHTVVAPKESAWLVVEGPLAPAKQKSLCYSLQTDFQLDSTGLYVPMTGTELSRIEHDERFYPVECLVRKLDGKQAGRG